MRQIVIEANAIRQAQSAPFYSRSCSANQAKWHLPNLFTRISVEVARVQILARPQTGDDPIYSVSPPDELMRGSHHKMGAPDFRAALRRNFSTRRLRRRRPRFQVCAHSGIHLLIVATYRAFLLANRAGSNSLDSVEVLWIR